MIISINVQKISTTDRGVAKILSHFHSIEVAIGSEVLKNAYYLSAHENA
jgi:hypothetical protein